MSNILIRGCPGTGKTFFARAVAYYMCKKNMTEKDAFAQNPMDDAGEIEKFVNGTAQCEFIQIHPSMEFDDIVYGLEVKASGGISLSYALILNGVFPHDVLLGSLLQNTNLAFLAAFHAPDNIL